MSYFSRPQAYLRTYIADHCKTPATQVNIGTKDDVFVLTEEQRHELIRLNRQWLVEHPPPPHHALPANGTPAATSGHDASRD